MSRNRNDPERQILGRVKRDEFIGRSPELERLVSHARRLEPAVPSPALLILAAPLAGISELLRQSFDRLFNDHEDVAPIYFSLPQTETTAVSAAIEFLNTFLLQYVAFRRNEPSLCRASLTLNDLLKLAPASDLEWIEELLTTYNACRFADDDRELVRFCLTAPARVSPKDFRPFVMFDATHLANYGDSTLPFASELVRALRSNGNSFVLAGLRREILDVVQRAGGGFDAPEVMHLENLDEADARSLVSLAAQRQAVSINDETRDLLVQQLEGSPFFISSLLTAAREQHFALDSYLNCERLYVDELLGGRLNRHFSSTLERMAPEPATCAAVVQLLCEAIPAGKGTTPVESWRRRLKADGTAIKRLLWLLHIQELINWDGETVNSNGSSEVWKDFLRSRFRLDALREPRALVVAEVMADALKRAPQTVAHHYRRAASLRLRELLSKFDSQLVPKKFFNYEEFATQYKGRPPEEVLSELDNDTELMRLPQIFHATSGVSFQPLLRKFGEEATVVAHGFDSGVYIEQNETVWLAAKVESKLEASAELVEQWLELLSDLALKAGFRKTQIWLIANEGFSPEATELLRAHAAYGSSRQQFELLAGRISTATSAPSDSESINEFSFTFPMGGDNELLAAMTVEQVARRLNFTTEAINQIKTAVVEACINASEHSLSPDRKISQRFEVESDRLVITISSRGILPANLAAAIENESAPGKDDETDDRRGWGLKLIQTLMDEVEFERVDEGTSLRMTKYLRERSE
jgi:serine/threonine-protein kinase RsbW